MDSSNHNTTSASNGTNDQFNPFAAFSSFTPFTVPDLQTNFENSVPNTRELQSSSDTLDEPVWQTLARDLTGIYNRLKLVVWPSDSVVDWDLWGPLIFSLTYSVVLGVSSSHTNQVFSGSFALIWLFFIIIGLNIQLLGGSISFLSAISAVGYSMFPITVGEIVCSLFSFKLIRLIVMVFMCAWSVYAGVNGLKSSGVKPGRVVLAVYPVGLMYAVMGWLSVIT